MPEGHTIHRLARDLQRDLAGDVVRAEARQERFAGSAERLDGTVLEGTEAWGKHLFAVFDSGDVLHVHLGLVGKFRRRRPSTEPSPALRLRLANETWAWDLTGPMTCRLGDPSLVDVITEGLGPDPLRRDADRARFVESVERSRRSMALLLLDQSVIAGIGNVYRSEALFLMGIHPRTRGCDLDRSTIGDLWDLLVRLLKDGVKRNRIVTRLPQELPKGRVARADALYAYKRASEPCRRCGTPIARDEVGARKAWWCPTCQPG